MRELENILERAVTLCADGQIQADDIRLRAVRARDARMRPPLPGPRPIARRASRNRRRALGSQLEDMERDAIVRALEQTRYNKTAAAKLLGMTFRALRYRIKKLGIE